MPSNLYTGDININRTSVICACCGALGHDIDNMYRPHVDGYADYINIISGEFENVENDKYKVVTVQTKNGPVTVGYRHAW